MKANELIAQLQQCIEEHGDLEVFFDDWLRGVVICSAEIGKRSTAWYPRRTQQPVIWLNGADYDED